MTDAALSPAPTKAPGKASPFNELEVLWVRHWTDSLFSFGLKRPEDFRFRSGEFVMIGLPGADGGKPVLRAYSIASPCWAEELEFFSIKVADGPLTSRLQKIVAGDTVLMGKKPTGTLVLDALTGGERLWLIGTGTGLAPCCRSRAILRPIRASSRSSSATPCATWPTWPTATSSPTASTRIP